VEDQLRDAAVVGVIADETNRANAAVLAKSLGRHTTVRRLTVTRGINGRGAKDLGVLPSHAMGYRTVSQNGKHGREILEAAAAGAVRALLFLGPADAFEAEFDLLNRSLRKVDCVVVIAATPGPVANAATVLIPGHTIFEKNGSVTNLEGRVQRVRPALPPASQTPSETRILAALATELGGGGFDSEDPIAVNRALREALPASTAAPPASLVPTPPPGEKGKAVPTASAQPTQWGTDAPPIKPLPASAPQPLPAKASDSSVPLPSLGPTDPYDPEPFNRKTHPEANPPHRQ